MKGRYTIKVPAGRIAELGGRALEILEASPWRDAETYVVEGEPDVQYVNTNDSEHAALVTALAQGGNEGVIRAHELRKGNRSRQR